MATLIKALWESPQKTNILSVGNCSLKEMKDSQKTRFGILWFLRKSCGKYLFLRKKLFPKCFVNRKCCYYLVNILARESLWLIGGKFQMRKWHGDPSQSDNFSTNLSLLNRGFELLIIWREKSSIFFCFLYDAYVILIKRL